MNKNDTKPWTFKTWYKIRLFILELRTLLTYFQSDEKFKQSLPSPRGAQFCLFSKPTKLKLHGSRLTQNPSKISLNFRDIESCHYECLSTAIFHNDKLNLKFEILFVLDSMKLTNEASFY